MTGETRKDATIERKKPAEGEPATPRGRTYWQIVRKQFRQNRLGMIGLTIFLGLVVIALLAPLLANDVPIIAKHKGRLCFPAFPTYLDTMPVGRGITDWLRSNVVIGGNNIFSTSYAPVETHRWLVPERAPEDVDPEDAQGTLEVHIGGFGTLRIAGQLVTGDAATQRAALEEALAGTRRAEGSDAIVRCVHEVRSEELPAAVPGLLELLETGPLAVAYTRREPILDRATWKQTIAHAWDEEEDWYLRPPVFFSFSEVTSEVKAHSGAISRWGPEEGQVATHWLGTDQQGRDVLARMIHGTIISLSVGVVAVSIYCTIGIVLGLIAGYFGGWIDILLSRITEVVICFPTFFLIITVIAFLDRSIYNIMIVIGVTSWTGVFRLMRGEVLKVKQLDFCAASRALGVPAWRIMAKHLFPNSLSPILVAATFGIASAILTENALSFLGFGVSQPTASWGEIVGQGRELVAESRYSLVLAPGLAIFLTVTVFNLMGQALRDAMDPRLRH